MHIHHKNAPSPKMRSEVITKAFINATQLLELKPKEITHLAGISTATWSRIMHQGRLIDISSKEAEYALLFLRIFRSLDALFGGNEERSREWLRAYNYHLNGIPLELIQKIEGLVQVTAYLDAMRGLA